MKTKHRGARSQAATRAWKERKSGDEAKWKKERKIDKEAARAFAQASRGRYGTMRLGMKENTDQGQIHVPLPSPEWIVTWRSTFNRAMKRQLEMIIEERGQGLKDFDPSYSEASHKVLEKAQTGLIRWLTTTPAYKGNNRNAKLRLLFEVNVRAKKDLPPSYLEQIMLESEGADQPDTPRAPDIRYVISDRFIPPDDTGATVYRSFSDDNNQEEDEGTAS
ncbi:hypothetical protein FA10DRAFT_294141 [Acaromyces ingoldii]|uniref:Uncharacterized protein n=1 Tax=Acaromyces ingoldii TaxID=215250 RepID=A0A316YMN7_9BASI|nr:hypothetical protein FA10DRAFT_294141 [Acaromyces ingoldii]PWN90519.1 hypothetical protein FA10DRAFT_294141 [Acaromyces ingoldii]